MFSFSQDFKKTAPWALLASVASSIWFYLVGYSPAFAGQGKLFDFLPNPERLAFFLAVIATGIVCAWLCKQFQRVALSLSLALYALMFVGTTAFALAGYQTLFSQSALATVGATLMAFGYGWTLLMALQILLKAPTDWDVALLVILSAACLVVLLGLVYFLSPISTQAILPILLVVVMAVAVSIAQRQQGTLATRRSPLVSAPEPSHFLRRTLAAPLDGTQKYYLIQLLVICIVVIALRSVGAGGLWGGLRSSAAPFDVMAFVPSLLAAALFLLCAVPAFWFHARSVRNESYQVPVLVLVAFFLVLAVLESGASGSVLFSVLSSAAERICLTIFSFLMIVSAKRLPYPGIFTLGFAVAFNHLVALVWMVFFEDIGILTNIIVLLISYIFMLLVAFRRMGEHREKDGALATEDVFAQMAGNCRAASARFGLTQRESELLVLLAQGRSMPYIQNALTLSEGTVRTHVNHIYAKLKVHSKQELIDLLSTQAADRQI
ncbi:MAG: helix-turn-helix transcriptional regulator [Coriobacteriales bacterium]|jgi:DNA-binding CsgD family transcriptional regulator|nr:helix-turn-helix transcriptional regulator [Coriobacteriales bacterium]